MIQTFLIDIDLSSLNDVVQSKSLAPRKNLKAPKGQRTNITPQAPDGDEDAVSSRLENNDSVSEASTGNVLQILDLDSHNPIISFQDQLYSCQWFDTIGTNMFFSHHSPHRIIAPLRTTDNYDLLGTSRIKLVGHRAKVTPKPNVKKRRRAADDDDSEGGEDVEEGIPEGRSLGGLVRTNPKTNIQIKKQAKFLEKFMDLKKARGEVDSVRTFVSRPTDTTSRNRPKDIPPSAMQQEIESLNRKVVKGDTEALARLQEIYSQLEDENT